MKKLMKPLVVAGLLATAGVSHAAIIYSDVAYGATDAAALEAAYVGSLFASTTETFDGAIGTSADVIGATNDSTDQGSWLLAAETFYTSVGSFTMTTPETPQWNDVEPGKLMLEDDTTGEFGRQEDYQSRWLDSNDADTVTWDILGDGTYDSLGFYLSDANDQGATLTLVFDDGSTHTEVLNAPLANGNIMYVSLISDTAITGATLTFDNGVGENDGWGIDNVTIGKVPEPGSLALFGLGILGLGVARKRTKLAA